MIMNKITQLVKDYLTKYGRKPNIIILPIKHYLLLLNDPKASANIYHDYDTNRDTLLGLEIHYVEKGKVQVYEEVYKYL